MARTRHECLTSVASCRSRRVGVVAKGSCTETREPRRHEGYVVGGMLERATNPARFRSRFGSRSTSTHRANSSAVRSRRRYAASCSSSGRGRARTASGAAPRRRRGCRGARPAPRPTRGPGPGRGATPTRGGTSPGPRAARARQTRGRTLSASGRRGGSCGHRARGGAALEIRGRVIPSDSCSHGGAESHARGRPMHADRYRDRRAARAVAELEELADAAAVVGGADEAQASPRVGRDRSSTGAVLHGLAPEERLIGG
jgi:hypothetical protein